MFDIARKAGLLACSGPISTNERFEPGQPICFRQKRMPCRLVAIATGIVHVSSSRRWFWYVMVYRSHCCRILNGCCSVFVLVRSGSIVPTAWRSAVAAPLHKGGAADQFTNCRPISLFCSCQKMLERLVLKRLLPPIDPLLDECPAGFRWGLGKAVLWAHSCSTCCLTALRKLFVLLVWRRAS